MGLLPASEPIVLPPGLFEGRAGWPLVPGGGAGLCELLVHSVLDLDQVSCFPVTEAQALVASAAAVKARMRVVRRLIGPSPSSQCRAAVWFA